MRKSGILFRFIDLGLVLLMAFLAVADISAEVQIQLPGGETTEASQAVLYRLHFDEAMQAQLEQLSGGKIYCRADSIAMLSACMLRAFDEHGQPVRFVLVPHGAATIQQLVILLDLCAAEDLRCTVES